MDQETRGVKNDEAADPCQDQNKRKNQKHRKPLTGHSRTIPLKLR